jgi:hypothetical protein
MMAILTSDSTPIAKTGLTTCSSGANAIEPAAMQTVRIVSRAGAGSCSAMVNRTTGDSENTGHAFLALLPLHPCLLECSSTAIAWNV